MSIIGIDEITFGALDIARCRVFFLDWGLQLIEETPTRLVYESLNGCKVIVAHSDTPGLPEGVEPDPTLREVVWGVETRDELEKHAISMANWPGFIQQDDRIGCTDPSGLAVRVQVSRKKNLELACAQVNTWAERSRIDQTSPAYDRAHPIEVGHVVFFVKELEKVSKFYQDVLGFIVSDRYPGRQKRAMA